MSTNFKKTLATLVLVAVASFGAVAPKSAKADTISDLQAQIAALMAQISALSGNTMTTTCAYNHSVTLKVGSSGSQVMAMQTVIGAVSDGKFGPNTKAKVMAFQASHGLVADGIVGANTGAAMAASCTSTTTTTTTTTTSNNGTLSGGVGALKSTSPTVLSQYNNEQVGEGENNVVVAGWQLEADNGSDLRLSSLRLKFDGTANTVSKTFTKYADTVSVMLDGNKVAEMDASDFSKDSTGVYSSNINLDSSAIIRAGHKADLKIAVSAVNTIDTTNLSGDAWTVDVENMRYMDGTGAILTETLSIVPVQMNFTPYSTAADTKLKLSTSSDTPDSQIVVVDDSNNTDNVVLLKGTIKLEGSSDVNMDSFPVTLETSGATYIHDVTNSLTLILDGEEYSEVVATPTGTTATITFDNLDFNIDAGDTINFEIRADINDIQAGSFDEGDNLKATVSSANRANIDATNDQGDQLIDSTEMTGTSTGEYQIFRTEGIDVALVSTSVSNAAGTAANDDVGTFEIKFKVTAIGDNMYVGTTVANAVTYTVDVGGVPTTHGLSAVIVDNSDTTQSSGENYMIEEGQSETFTLTVAKTNSTSADVGLTRANLTGVQWNTDDSTTYNPYSSNLDDFHTGYISLN